MPPAYRASDFRRIALRATGGKVKAIFWHLGVRAALEDRGFSFVSGFGPQPEPAPGQIGLLVGSSAGSVFSLLAAGGFDVPDILASFIGKQSILPQIDESTIFRRNHGSTLANYFRRVRNAVNLRAGAELFPGSGVHSSAAAALDDSGEPIINAEYKLTLRKFRRYFKFTDLLAIRSRYELSGMEEWFRALLGSHDRFEELRARVFIVASDLDQPLTGVFGSRDEDCNWYRYYSGVRPSRAAAASMAIPSVFNPVPIDVAGRKHYFVDGDVYNPTDPMVEADHKCDLAIISSFEAPYRFHPAIGSLHHLGLPYEVTQTIALMVYSRFMAARRSTRAKTAALEAARDLLAPHLDEEALERATRRIADALEISVDMKILYLHPYKNPLLFFENPFDLSSRTLAKMLVEASLQASELLDKAGFTA